MVFAIGATAVRAQQPVTDPPPEQVAPQRLSAGELDKLLAPIALYPDALIAILLPASTVPSDVVLAARYVASDGDPAHIGNQPWDESVKSLARYPDVLKWMDENLDWTTTVGDAFLDQPADVMNSVQRLRAQALAAGNLTDTPQQQVIKEETYIRIVPAEPEVIYVPEYDPEVVYVQPYRQDYGPAVTFSVGFAVGAWLNYDCDWNRRGVYVGRWRPGWRHDWDRGDRDWDRGGRDWDREDRGPGTNVINVVNIEQETARQWQPQPGSQRRQAQQQRVNRANARLSSQQAREVDRRTGSPGATDVGLAAIPRPSRIDVPQQGRERVGREARVSDSRAPAGLPATANVPAAEGNRRGTDPGTASSVAPDRGSAPAVDREGDARNVRRQEASGRQDSSRPPTVSGGQAASAQGGGQESVPRNVSKQGRGNRQKSGRGNAGGEAPGDQRVPEATAAPAVAGEQGQPSAEDVKQERGSRQKRDQDTGGAPSAKRNDDRGAPGRTAPPTVEGTPAPPGTTQGQERSSRRRDAKEQRGSRDAPQPGPGQTSPQAVAEKSSGDQGTPSINDRQKNSARDSKMKSQAGSGNGQPPPADKSPPRQDQHRNADQTQRGPSQSGPPQQRPSEQKREQKAPSQPPPRQSQAQPPQQQPQQPAQAQPGRSAEAAQGKAPSQAPKAEQKSPSQPGPRQSKAQPQQPAQAQPGRPAEAAQGKAPSQAPKAQGKGKGKEGDKEGKKGEN